MSGRPDKICDRCGTPTSAQAGICRTCRSVLATEKRIEANGDKFGLLGGHWMPNRRGVLVWVRETA